MIRLKTLEKENSMKKDMANIVIRNMHLSRAIIKN
jgi:hypothetical protein